ncbi:DMT family transporter [Helicobacter sp. 23-1048]
MNAWIILSFAILCEVSATTALKYSAISGSKIFIAGFVLLMGVSFALLYQAIKTIDLSTAYAVWSGIGLVLVSCVGFVVFREQVSAIKILCIALILIGVVGLKLLSKA